MVDSLVPLRLRPLCRNDLATHAPNFQDGLLLELESLTSVCAHPGRHVLEGLQRGDPAVARQAGRLERLSPRPLDLVAGFAHPIPLSHPQPLRNLDGPLDRRKRTRTIPRPLPKES